MQSYSYQRTSRGQNRGWRRRGKRGRNDWRNQGQEEKAPPFSKRYRPVFRPDAQPKVVERREDMKQSQQVEPKSLPISEKKDEILDSIERDKVTIIQAPTGSGKTTQVPKFINGKWPQKKIVVSQPRRLPVFSVSMRLAKELKSQIGGKVGWHVKGSKNYNDATSIVFMTSGMLIQEITAFQKQSGYHTTFPWDVVILDEIHQRSLQIDFLMVILKVYCSQEENNFKLVLMTATLQQTVCYYYSNSQMNKVRENLINLPQQNQEEQQDYQSSEQEDQWDNIWLQIPEQPRNHNKVPQINQQYSKNDKIQPIHSGTRLFTVHEM